MTLTQAPLQSTVLLPHATLHLPSAQTLPAGQTEPQVPQSDGLFARSTQTPLQRVVPPGQAHRLAMHETPEGQASPQAPQFAWFDVRSTQAPLQLVVPAKHSLVQRPPLQTLPAGQALLQFPQLAGSDVRSTHTPEHVVWVAQTPPSQTGNGSRSSEARPQPTPATEASVVAKIRPERNRRKLDMACAPSETPHDAPVEAQRFNLSLHRARWSAKRFALPLSAGAFAALLAGPLACSSVSTGSVSSAEPTASLQSAIEDGTTDVAHTFAVGVVQMSNQELAFCSGVLLAPNLMATARHCVAPTSSQQIDCATSTFGAVLPVDDLLVTTATVIIPQSDFARVAQIIVPSGADQTKVCGNDIALMILDRNIDLAQYVEPAINPPMTDHSVYSTTVTAIGYGLSTPLDEAGVTAGTRRIKENIPLYCIPNDTTFANCFTDPMAEQVLSADEFVSGDASTCEGDSGSGAFDQASFNRGLWVAFGILSRGAVSSDGQTCIQPVYSRFDAWGSLLTGAATQAASLGGYAAPVWAGGTGPVTTQTVDAAAESGSAANDEASTSMASPPGPVPGTVADGKPCGLDTDCASQNCVSTDDVTFVCASPCNQGSCSAGFVCKSGYCFVQAESVSANVVTHAKAGCAVSTLASTGQGAGWASGLAVLALVVVASGRRRSRSRSSNR